MSPVFAQDVDPGLADACGETDPGYICEKVWDWTDSQLLATAADWILDRPIRIIFILILAWVISKFAQRAVVRFTKGIAATPRSARLQALRERGPGRLLIEESESKRVDARAETIGLVLRSVVVAVIWTFAAMMVLGELDISLGPLVAGAGIGGIALGFGAQSIVKDFLSGLFMLIEDQYGVGDYIDVGVASGTVEQVSLRSTTLRDTFGTVWHIPNGEIARVGNKSQLWSRAVIDIEVSYDTDLRMAMGVVQRVADQMWEDPDWGGDELMDTPEVRGVQSLGASGIALRLMVKTEPSQQWAVERELRLRLKEALDEAGIEIPFPQQTMWVRNQGEFPVPPAPDPGNVVTHEPRKAADEEVEGAEPPA